MRTKAGTDHQARSIYDPANPATGAYAPMCYIAFTANSAAPADTDTSLAGEITTAGGGLIRGLATYGHTNGTNTATLSRQATMNANDVTPVTLNKSAIFNAGTGGTMGYESAMPTPPTLSFANGSGDSVLDNYTFTL